MSFNIESLQSLPRHVAIIMDGNGRWSQAQGLKRIKGHHQGAKTLQKIITAAVEWQINYLTVFAFSSENWSRPSLEVKGLMNLLKQSLKKGLSDLQQQNIRLRVIGYLEKIPLDIQKVIANVIEQTKNHTGLQLTIALSYGGRGEIVAAVKKIAQKIESRQLGIQDINEEMFAHYLDTAELPDPDLLIRTSGEQRISNFLLWQIAYTELFFTDTLWPDFSVDHFYQSLQYYAQRERRYGNVPHKI